ncbi:hypothetical protein ACFYO1_27315 [Nocardia sp. NPDC006044]|uniref:hypothetical protein n=1 Tax=Nocardia sp. NPDC006044 TaxID=3364306 RepID=UPI0036B809FC
MSGPSKYVRTDWFGPESFAAAVVGMISIVLPYSGVVPRDAVWCVIGPLVIGGLLVAVSAAGLPYSENIRRIGVGLLAAFAGLLLSVIGFLAGLAIGAIFT